MKTLLLMRHAKSSWAEFGMKDFDRPLNSRGQAAAPLMAKHLVSQQLVPDQILCSSARRTQETVERMLPLFPSTPAVTALDELYHASFKTIVSCINEVTADASRLLVIGHNPGMEELVLSWTARFLDFPTAAVASFSIPDSTWSKLRTDRPLTLTDFWKPKEISNPNEAT